MKTLTWQKPGQQNVAQELIKIIINYVAELRLSFFTPPKTDVEEIPYIDKIVHICMYGGLCFILWIEYLRNHKAINWNHVIWGGIIAPVAMSGCIELMQAYCTDTRSGDWLDFLANSIGVGLAALIGYYLLRPLIWRKS